MLDWVAGLFGRPPLDRNMREETWRFDPSWERDGRASAQSPSLSTSVDSSCADDDEPT